MTKQNKKKQKKYYYSMTKYSFSIAIICVSN